jgi:cellulose synthase/poly-beta-1,6-N-acetylglucosamine synthase-like glycosyltransferase
MITLAWAAAAFALLPLMLAALNLRSFARPQVLPPAGTAVSILIPARDEAKTVAETVRSALESIAVEVEVLVLDDNSTDDTAGIVSRLADRDARVRLLRAPPLPPGWAGKQRACHLLSERARFETLMFIDADLLLAPKPPRWRRASCSLTSGTEW